MFKINKCRVGRFLCPRGYQSAWADDIAVCPPYDYFENKFTLAMVQRLNAQIVRFLHSAEAKEKFLSVGVESVGTSPEQLTATMTAEMSRMGKVIRDAGIRED